MSPETIFGHTPQTVFVFVNSTCDGFMFRLEKTNTRCPSVSRHHGSPIEGPPSIPQFNSAVIYEGLQKGPQLKPDYAERRLSL